MDRLTCANEKRDVQGEQIGSSTVELGSACSWGPIAPASARGAGYVHPQAAEPDPCPSHVYSGLDAT